MVSNSTVKVQKVKDTGSAGMEERKVLVDGLNPETTEDCLRNFLEVKAGAEPNHLMYSETRERTIVNFSEDLGNFLFSQRIH